MAAPLPSELELKLKYDSIPLSKRLSMVGTGTMTKNSLQTEVHWGEELNFVDKETGFTPLMAAALNGSAASVSTLIERGAEINYQEPKRGRTALLLASKNGKSEIVEILLHRGAGISIADKNGVTALMWASKNGHLSCVISLLSRGAGINTFDNFDWTAVHYAAKHGHCEIVEVLGNAGAALQIREKLEEGKTPLMLAAQYGRRDTVNCLLEQGSDINARTTQDDLTALMLAAKEGHKGTVKVLIERGADSGISDSYGWTALHFAASWGRKETAIILITEGGANIDAMPRKKLSGGGGTTPLIIATKGQQVDVLSLLLEYGANPGINDEATGRNPMAYAAAEGLSSVVQCLIEHKVDLNVRDTKGMTPLMLAVIGGHAEPLRLLLAACADINIMDTENKTALDHATQSGRRDMYLMAILKSSPACKANVIAWLERDTPKMIRGSPSGGPSVFLNNILYGSEGLYAGLYFRPPELDVHLLHNLVMLAASCKKSIRSQPMDSSDLEHKISELDDMLLMCVDTRAFCLDHNLSHALMLQQFPEANQADGQYDYRFFAGAFVSGPLALYIENGLSRVLASVQVSRIIEQVFTCSLRGPGAVGESGYGSRSVMLNLRYCPAFMFLTEGLSKLFMLALVVSVLQDPSSTTTYFSSTSDHTLMLPEQILMIHTALSIIYELGAMEEKAWATSPSISVDPHELSLQRFWGSRLHLVSNIWSQLDLCTLLLVLLWAVLKFSLVSDQLPSDNGISRIALSISAIPLCMGLIRYPSIFMRRFGQLALAIMHIAKDLTGFLVIFAVSGAGFGIALFGMFQDLPMFRTPAMVFRALFDAVNQNYDLGMFDESTGQKSVGATIFIVFVIWTVVVLLNTIVAHIVATYESSHAQAQREWLLLKSQLIRQYLLIQEKSPLCMLPAPFNALPASLYAIHVLYTWRARLFPGKHTCASFAGSVSDMLLKVLFLLPAAFVEYFLAISAEPSRWKRNSMLIMAPYGVMVCLGELLFKVLVKDSSAVKLLVKSRLKDGRLRVSYGDSRDFSETIGVVEKAVQAFKFEKSSRKPRGNTLLPGEEAPLRESKANMAETKKISSLKVAPYAPDANREAGDQGHLWNAALDEVLARHHNVLEGSEEKNEGLTHEGSVSMPAPLLGTVSRQDSSVSLMSDISSGELLQRFPPSKTVSNDLPLNSFAGLFMDHEKRDIFGQALHDFFMDEQLRKQKSSDVEGLMEQLRVRLNEGLEDVTSRQDRMFMQLTSMLGQLQNQQSVGNAVMPQSASPMSPLAIGFNDGSSLMPTMQF